MKGAGSSQDTPPDKPSLADLCPPKANEPGRDLQEPSRWGLRPHIPACLHKDIVNIS